jgi:hypothetical protein
VGIKYEYITVRFQIKVSQCMRLPHFALIFFSGVGYKDVVETLLSNRNATKMFLPFSTKKYFILQNINQSKNIYYKSKKVKLSL